MARLEDTEKRHNTNTVRTIRVCLYRTRMVRKIVPYAYGMYHTRMVHTIRVRYKMRIWYRTEILLLLWWLAILQNNLIIDIKHHTDIFAAEINCTIVLLAPETVDMIQLFDQSLAHLCQLSSKGSVHGEKCYAEFTELGNL